MGRDDKTVIAVEEKGSLYKLLDGFLKAYKARTEVMANQGGGIGETTIAQKLDAIIEMLRPLGVVPSQLTVNSERLEIIHGLIDEIKNSLPKQPGPPAHVEFVKFVFPGLKESE